MISGKNPKPICISPPRLSNLKVCARFYNVFFPGRNFHFCLGMNGQWRSIQLFDMTFDCLRWELIIIWPLITKPERLLIVQFKSLKVLLLFWRLENFKSSGLFPFLLNVSAFIKKPSMLLEYVFFTLKRYTLQFRASNFLNNQQLIACHIYTLKYSHIWIIQDLSTYCRLAHWVLSIIINRI